MGGAAQQNDCQMIRKQILLLILCISIYPLLGRGQGEAPWTFWYWMYGAVSKDGIKADLKCMKDIGLGGCYLMPIRGTNDKGAPQNPPQGGKWAEALSPHRQTLWACRWEFISATVLPWPVAHGFHPRNRCRKWFIQIPSWRDNSHN